MKDQVIRKNQHTYPYIRTFIKSECKYKKYYMYLLILHKYNAAYGIIQYDSFTNKYSLAICCCEVVEQVLFFNIPGDCPTLPCFIH